MPGMCRGALGQDTCGARGSHGSVPFPTRAQGMLPVVSWPPNPGFLPPLAQRLWHNLPIFHPSSTLPTTCRARGAWRGEPTWAGVWEISHGEAAASKQEPWCGWCTFSCTLGGICPPQGTPAGCRGTSSSPQVSSGTHTGLEKSGVHEKRRFGEGWDAPMSPPRLLTGGGRRSPLLLRTGTSQLIPTAQAGDEALDGARRWARRRAPSCSALRLPPSWPGCHAKEAVTEILMLPRRSNWHQLNCYIHV